MSSATTTRRYMALTTVITLLLFLLPALLVIIVDPYFFFHKPFYMRTTTFSGTERFQNAGLINSYLADPKQKIDSILIGTSLSQNFPVLAMKNAHDIPILKLTVAGGFSREKAAIFEHAMATGNVRHVVWEVISGYSSSNPDEINEQVDFPFYLYNKKLFDQWHYIFNNDVVERALGVLKGRKKGRETLDKLYTWQEEDSFTKFNTPDNLKRLAANLKKSNHVVSVSTIAPHKGEFPNVEINLLDHIRRYPKTVFQLYFPPASYYQYALISNQDFAKEMRMREYILRETASMKNVKIYGFDLIDGVGNTMSNYRDSAHYRPSTNALIADSLVHDTHQLTLKNWPAYYEALVKRINSYSADFLKKNL